MKKLSYLEVPLYTKTTFPTFQRIFFHLDIITNRHDEQVLEITELSLRNTI